MELYSTVASRSYIYIIPEGGSLRAHDGVAEVRKEKQKQECADDIGDGVSNTE